MIILKGNKLFFSGKDATLMLEQSKLLGLSVQNLTTGLLWEMIMRKAREGVFLNGKKKEGMDSKRVHIRGTKKDMAMEPRKKQCTKGNL